MAGLRHVLDCRLDDSKWIDQADKGREARKLAEAFSGKPAESQIRAVNEA